MSTAESQIPVVKSETTSVSPDGVSEGGETALVITEPSVEENSTVHLKEILSAKSALGALPVELKVAIPIPSFRVRDLVTIEKGRVLASDWANGEDLPLSCGDTQLVWTEFEVVDQKMAVRVTRLA
jgi:flagellar motor switch protein FliN/FliY